MSCRFPLKWKLPTLRGDLGGDALTLLDPWHHDRPSQVEMAD